MHPTLSYHLATALIAHDHARAERARTAGGAKKGRSTPQPDHWHTRPRQSARALARRALSLLAARST
jgi:hypothetical protein